MSVLFADLVGFTTLAEGLDPEDLATIQDAYFATVRDIVGRYRGSLEKFIGDAAMAVFGTPRAEDDDALRAVQAGLALVHAVGDLGARLGLEAEELRLRVGINTGEVLVATGGPDAGRVSGDTVNVAAASRRRPIRAACLSASSTALSVAHAVELEAVEPLALKGKTTARAGLAGPRPAPGAVARARDGAPAGADARAGGGAGPAPGRRRGGAAGDRRPRACRRAAGGRQDAAARGARGEFAGGRRAGTSCEDGPRRAARRSTAIARLVRHAFGASDRRAPPAEVVARVARPSSRAVAPRWWPGTSRSLLEPGARGGVPRPGRAASRAGPRRSGPPSTGGPGVALEDLHWAGGDLLAFLDAAAAGPAPGG